ncbi:MAG: tetratricopeptide repeat protein [Terracidiphilus sp.]|jgi:tetratricopeptide (TPR) repeat protein
MDEHRWLSAFACLAALVIAPVAALGQTGTQAPASSPQSPLTTSAPPAPTSPEELGDSLMAHQRYQAAIAAYKNAPPNSADALNKMGIAYQMMFNLVDASHCYQASLKLDPKNARVLNNLGTVYDAMRQYSNAERMYHRALKIEPDSALILKNLGTNQLTQHKYKKGWEAYKTALAIDPKIFEDTGGPRVDNPASASDRGAMNYYMARSCVRAGMKDQAIEYLRKALNEGFTNPKKIIADSEFAGLRGNPAFEQLLTAQSIHTQSQSAQ